MIAGNKNQDVKLRWDNVQSTLSCININEELADNASIGIWTDQTASIVKDQAFTSGMASAEDYIDRFFMNSMDGFEDLALGVVGSEIGFVGGATLKVNDGGSQGHWRVVHH